MVPRIKAMEIEVALVISGIPTNEICPHGRTSQPTIRVEMRALRGGMMKNRQSEIGIQTTSAMGTSCVTIEDGVL